MAKYYIEMRVNYEGEVEADTEEEARDYFISRRESMYYESVDFEKIEEIEEEEEDDDA